MKNLQALIIGIFAVIIGIISVQYADIIIGMFFVLVGGMTIGSSIAIMLND